MTPPQQSNMMVEKSYILGLRGKQLRNAQIWAVILPTYILYAFQLSYSTFEHPLTQSARFGYNNGVAGSLLELPSWIETFPRIDTVNSTGSQRTDNSRIQVGM